MIRSSSTSTNVQLVELTVDSSNLLSDNSFTLQNIWYIANANPKTAYMREMTMFWYTINSVTHTGT